MLHGKHADTLTGVDAAISIRHMQANPFLAHDDGTDIRFGACLDDRVYRVADDELDAFPFQDVG